jgi:hypothetical protein
MHQFFLKLKIVHLVRGQGETRECPSLKSQGNYKTYCIIFNALVK